MAKNSLLEKLSKNSKIKHASILTDSSLLNGVDVIPTSVPALNIAFSGSLDGGLTAGLTEFAGESKTFKSNFSLLCAKAYLDKYDDAVLIFYDSEFGASPDYFKAFGIDTDRVLHTPVLTVEELKVDIANQLEGIERGDHVIIIVDSIGNLASKKEVQDAKDDKSSADMTRAKQLKSLTRIITSHLTLKNIPMIMINHTYQSLDLFSHAVIGGGCVVKGTEITMADGTFKKVEDVCVGDMVKTLVGENKVTHTWNPDTLVNGTPECYEIEFEDGHKVICSDVHKFAVDDHNCGRWVEARDLVVGTDVMQI